MEHTEGQRSHDEFQQQARPEGCKGTILADVKWVCMEHSVGRVSVEETFLTSDTFFYRGEDLDGDYGVSYVYS
jgi:hypothetical protein